MEAWAVLEYDFASLLHVDLEDARRQRRSLRWLTVRVQGLLSDERSLLYQRFAPQVSETPAAEPAPKDEGWVGG